MFGFKNRKRYNGAVDERFSIGHGIDTSNRETFPGVLASLR